MAILRSPYALLLISLAVAGSATTAHASLDLKILASNTSAGGTGSFDVVLFNSGGAFNVSAFSFELRVAANSGVLFTDVNVSTASPYIFGTLQASPLSYSKFPTTDFIAGDSDQTDFIPGRTDPAAPYSVTVAQNSTFGLGHVTYTVAAGATPGPITVSFVGTSGTNRTTEVLDENNAVIPITAANGTISVDSAVPEPASAILMALGMAGTVGVTVRSARRR